MFFLKPYQLALRGFGAKQGINVKFASINIKKLETL